MKQLCLAERDVDAANNHFWIVLLDSEIGSEGSISDMLIYAYILKIAFVTNRYVYMTELGGEWQLVKSTCEDFFTHQFFSVCR